MNDDRTSYPRSWSWKKDGDVLDGLFGRIDAVPGTDYYNKPVTKVVLELDLVETDETVTCWCDDTKLKGMLGRELKLRGKQTFEPGEHLIIKRSSEKRPSKTSEAAMWDYDVWYEHASPRPGVVDALLGESGDGGEPHEWGEVDAA